MEKQAIVETFAVKIQSQPGVSPLFCAKLCDYFQMFFPAFSVLKCITARSSCVRSLGKCNRLIIFFFVYSTHPLNKYSLDNNRARICSDHNSQQNIPDFMDLAFQA